MAGSMRDVWGGFVVMIVCVTTGLIVAVAVGPVIDTIHASFLHAGIYTISDPVWADPSFAANTSILINLAYLVQYIIPLFGVGVFFLTIFRRYRRDIYE